MILCMACMVWCHKQKTVFITKSRDGAPNSTLMTVAYLLLALTIATSKAVRKLES